MKPAATPTPSHTLEPDRVLAKSDGKSLLAHIEDCLQVYQALCRALPVIPSLVGLEDFFDLLFCTVYFHDWGKAHKEFQKLLKGQNSHWMRRRHEIFSVPFVEMLPLAPHQKELISQCILGHHKDFDQLVYNDLSDREVAEYAKNLALNNLTVNPFDFQENLQRQLEVLYLVELKKRLQDCYNRYVHRPRQFILTPVDFASQENPIRKYARPYLQRGADPADKTYWQQMLLLGCTKICDQLGSAEVKDLPTLSPQSFCFLDKFESRWFPHQKQCGDIDGHLFLLAPTGSGKTEAALRWVRKQLQGGHQGRVFYVLPYTASINAMHQRLIKDFEEEGARPGRTVYVGVRHGKIDQYLAQYLEDQSNDPLESQTTLKKLKDLHRQMVHPLKVVTPFQILKYCYGVKGFEMGFSELAGAMLIFDEIHAYDSQTFAQISASLNWLRQHLKIRVLVMTATLPAFMLQELVDALGRAEIVRADQELLEKFTRHCVYLHDGNIFARVPAIKENLAKGLKVIVVCNTVARAQEMFRRLKEGVAENKSVLLHSRFIAEHRFAKERALGNDEVILLVGTQAIEVSLDIDFDLMFTEPAPLDALIQRFGRINRRRRKGICPVHVCRQGGEHDHYIYPPDNVARTLQILEGVTVLQEKELPHLLDEVYPDWPDRIKYEETKQGFAESLNRLKPFRSHQEEEESFYKKFTGISVIPVCYQLDYENAIAEYEFLKAESLSINLHIATFIRLLKAGLIEKDTAVYKKKAGSCNIKYWLIKCNYDPQLGLLTEEDISSLSTTIVF